MRFKSISLAVIIIISGCASKELRTEINSCEKLGYIEFPIVEKEELKNTLVPNRVPFSTNCLPPLAPGLPMNCTTTYTTTYITVAQVVKTDINKINRQDYVDKCVRFSCMNKYFNAKCEPMK